MILCSLGPLYIGLDQESFLDLYCTSAAAGIHLGRLRLELDCPQLRSHGSTQTPDHKPNHR